MTRPRWSISPSSVARLSWGAPDRRAAPRKRVAAASRGSHSHTGFRSRPRRPSGSQRPATRRRPTCRSFPNRPNTSSGSATVSRAACCPQRSTISAGDCSASAIKSRRRTAHVSELADPLRQDLKQGRHASRVRDDQIRELLDLRLAARWQLTGLSPRRRTRCNPKRRSVFVRAGRAAETGTWSSIGAIGGDVEVRRKSLREVERRLFCEGAPVRRQPSPCRQCAR